MSVLARTALRSARAPAASFRAQAIQRRSAHFDNVAGNVCGHPVSSSFTLN